jgi:hypothetical protein
VKSLVHLSRIYAFALALTVLILVFVGHKNGMAGVITVLILAGIEITFSFDNAVINTKILRTQSPFWQKMFMTVGIFIAVFGVRFLLPIVIVAVTAGLGFVEVTKLALNDPVQYSEHLAHAKPLISAFGGIFLLMVFLDFLLTNRSIKWIQSIERAFVRLGTLKNFSVTVSLVVLMAIAYGVAEDSQHERVLVAGMLGLIGYLMINALDSLSEPHQAKANTTKMAAFKAGIIGFLYLQMIDASFSLDSVVGAFAITQDIILIAAGLGIGALYVRSMTVHMMKGGVLDRFRYVEHGAHYAIGILAVILLVSVRHEVPEIISGLTGLAVIVYAFVDSSIANRHHRPLEADQ